MDRCAAAAWRAVGNVAELLRVVEAAGHAEIRTDEGDVSAARGEREVGVQDAVGWSAGPGGEDDLMAAGGDRRARECPLERDTAVIAQVPADQVDTRCPIVADFDPIVKLTTDLTGDGGRGV